MSDFKDLVAENFTRYAGNVILDRAICDARDLLKPSARMLMYCQLAVTKNIPSKPFVKSARVVGDALGHYYTHGDSSCYGTYMRMAKPFAMRYPLEDCQGNCGTINATGDEAAARYTELRLSKLGNYLFSQIDKDTIIEWANNFDETEQYPKVLPSLGFYNLVNGSTGIGVSLSASLPQFNLKEMNSSLIKLLWNPNVPFEEICIMPDFATGAIILNRDEVVESLRNGEGYAIKLRSIIDYDSTKRTLKIKELPYGVYTETISGQIQKLLEEHPDCGIDGVNDASGKTPDYEIYLTKTANVNKVLKLLYKETSLQSFYSINMTVLKNGKQPVIMGLKELMLEHINHELIVYRRGFEFDLNKIKHRLYIIDGLIICLENIDEVVSLIKKSSSPATARAALCEKYLLDDEQAKAIVDMKLARLTNLEVNKLMDEKEELENEATRIQAILDNEDLLKREVEKGLIEVAEKFGDARRTQIMNLSTNENDEVIEEKTLFLNLTNHSNLFINETSTLLSQKRGGVGTKFKLEKGEQVIDSCFIKNTDTLLFFSKKGNYYSLIANEVPINEKVYLGSLMSFDGAEEICSMIPAEKKENIIFVTRNGYVKKSALSEYNTRRKVGVKALTLDDTDEICTILFTNKENIGILTENGNFLMFDSETINPIGRIARGVKGIKLDDEDYVCSASVINDKARELCFITKNGLSKRVDIKEFTIANRYTKGAKVQKLKSNEDKMVDFIVIENEKGITIVSTKARIVVELSDIPALTKSAAGSKTMKLGEEKVIGFSKF